MNDSLENFFQAPEPALPVAAARKRRAQPVQLDPVKDHARAGRAELHPMVQQQAERMRVALQTLEQQSKKMRDALHRLEGTAPERRAVARTPLYERRRADRRDPSDPNQLFLFDEKFLQRNFAAPPADLPSAVDGASVENYAISLAYGNDGLGMVGTVLVALAKGDSNGDGIIDSNDVYPDQSPVTNLYLDLNKVREGMMLKVRELVSRFDVNHNGRIDGPREAFEFLDHVAHIDFNELHPKRDAQSGMITSESFVEAFGEVLNRGLTQAAGTDEN